MEKDLEYYNNLNCFNDSQLLEIEQGLMSKIDVEVYAKKDFTWEQMNEIRWGLMDNLDVDIYAKKDYNWKEMQYIRFELLKRSVKNDNS